MIEDESRLSIVDKIAKAFEIRNQHSATLRHRFKRRQSKRLAAVGQGRIDKETRRAKSLFQFDRIKDRPGEDDLTP